jgi:hypothetical protein
MPEGESCPTVSRSSRDSSCFTSCSPRSPPAGSFDTSDKTGQSFTVTSLPDPDAQKALAGSLFGSSEKTKKFTYKDGELTYEFSMMGVESIVHMSRGAK